MAQPTLPLKPPRSPLGAGLKAAADALERLVLALVAVLLGCLVVVVFIQVLARYVFRVATVWSQEAAIFCFIWSVFLAAAVAVRRRRHFVLGVLPGPHPLVRFLSEAGMAALALVYAWYGTRVALRNYVVLSQPSEIPLTYFMAPIPLCGFLILFFLLEGAVNGPSRQPAETGP